MGDRVLFQVVSSKSGRFSPVAYGHGSGFDVVRVCRELQVRMAERVDDVPCAFARLVQILINGDDGDTGFGCWNATAKLTSKESHGDAGIVIVDVSKPTFTYECFGGYMVAGPDGLPRSKYDDKEETT